MDNDSLGSDGEHAQPNAELAWQLTGQTLAKRRTRFNVRIKKDIKLSALHRAIYAIERQFEVASAPPVYAPPPLSTQPTPRPVPRTPYPVPMPLPLPPAMMPPPQPPKKPTMPTRPMPMLPLVSRGMDADSARRDADAAGVR